MYKFCKFCKNCASYTPLHGLYSIFWSNISKNFSFGGPMPLSLHRLGWNLARRRGPLLRAKLHPHWCNITIPLHLECFEGHGPICYLGVFCRSAEDRSLNKCEISKLWMLESKELHHSLVH